MSLFPSIFCTIAVFSLYGEYVVRFLSFRMVFFYLMTTGWIFDISLCENSNQINKEGSRSSTPQICWRRAQISPGTHCCLSILQDSFSPCSCCCCFSHSSYWLPTRKDYFPLDPNPARGLLNTRKREQKKKVWQHTPSPPTPHTARSEKKKKTRDARTGATLLSVVLASVRVLYNLSPTFLK